MRLLKYWMLLLLLSGILAAIAAVVTWAYYDWTTARVMGAATLALGCVAALIGLQPESSRARRWGTIGVGFVLVGLGVALTVGLPDHRHQFIGVSILTTIGMSTLARLWDIYVGKPSFGVGSDRPHPSLSNETPPA